MSDPKDPNEPPLQDDASATGDRLVPSAPPRVDDEHDFGPEPWESAPPPVAPAPAAAPTREYGAGAPPEAFVDGEATADAKRPVFAVYLLYLAAFVLAVPAVIGVWLAYARRAEAPRWLDSHYAFQIRTFWIAVAAAIGGVLLMFLPFGLGPLVLMAVVVWVTLRCFVGMVRLHRGEPIYNPQTWIA